MTKEEIDNRKCGICGVRDIPRGIEWPFWHEGLCVHPACAAKLAPAWFKDEGQSLPYAGPNIDWLRVPTSRGVYCIAVIQPKDRRCPWLNEFGELPPEVSEEWEVVTVPIKMLLRKGGPRP